MTEYVKIRSALARETAGGGQKKSAEMRVQELLRVLEEREVADAVQEFGQPSGGGKALDVLGLTYRGGQLRPMHPTSPFHPTTGAPNFTRDADGNPPPETAILTIKSDEGQDLRFRLDIPGRPREDDEKTLPETLAKYVTAQDVMEGMLNVAKTMNMRRQR